MRKADLAELAQPEGDSSEPCGLDWLLALAQELGERETKGATRADRMQCEIVETSSNEMLGEYTMQVAGRICCRIAALKIPDPKIPSADFLTCSADRNWSPRVLPPVRGGREDVVERADRALHQ